MSYQIRIQKALNYIEEHLEDNIVLENLAVVSGFSLFHFHRVFQEIVGDTVKEYIRRRRLNNAAHELTCTQDRIIDIAVKNQYKSQESFSRAFKRFFGTTPGKYRKQKRQFILQDKVALLKREKVNHQGLCLEPKIIDKPEFVIVGLEYYGLSATRELYDLFGEFWTRIGEIKNQVDPKSAYGIHFYDSMARETGCFAYIFGVQVSSINDIPQGMTWRTVPAGKYAVFTHQGRICKLVDFYKWIYGTWRPDSGYELPLSHDLQLMDERFTGNNDSSIVDIYVPIMDNNLSV